MIGRLRTDPAYRRGGLSRPAQGSHRIDAEAVGTALQASLTSGPAVPFSGEWRGVVFLERSALADGLGVIAVVSVG
jgi:hypothetical protein